jgi:ABC-2 type transport system ATP-binding protein
VIEAAGIRKAYGATLVLDDVSLTLPAGQCLALLGPNGAGKTTLLRILAGLVRPSAGRLRVGGADAVRDPEAVRAQVGMVAPRLLRVRGPHGAGEPSVLGGDGRSRRLAGPAA